MISRIFYNNLIILKKSLEEELNKININIKEIDIIDKGDVAYLTKIINEIVFINRNDYKVLSLFTNIDNNKYDLYSNWYGMLLSKYIANIDFIKAYRKYKSSN